MQVPGASGSFPEDKALDEHVYSRQQAVVFAEVIFVVDLYSGHKMHKVHDPSVRHTNTHHWGAAWITGMDVSPFSLTMVVFEFVSRHPTKITEFVQKTNCDTYTAGWLVWLCETKRSGAA